jgi:hypothetical protein
VSIMARLEAARGHVDAEYRERWRLLAVPFVWLWASTRRDEAMMGSSQRTAACGSDAPTASSRPTSAAAPSASAPCESSTFGGAS